MNDIDLRIIDLAAETGGVVSRSTLLQAGASHRQVRRMVAGGVLRRLTPATYLVRGHALDWRRRVRAAVAHVGDAAASHATAAAILQYPQIGPGAVEVTIARGRRAPRSTIGRVHVSRRPPDPGELIWVDGLPVTGHARTLLDLAPRLSTGHLGRCVIDLCHRGDVTLAGLRDEVDRLRGRGVTGGPRLERVLSGCEDVPVVDSFLEAKFMALVRSHGFPMPRTQVVITVDGREYRVDALWDDWRFIVELNGYGTHASRLQLAADAARAARLQSAGYELVVFTYDQVMDDPRFVLAQVGLRLSRPRVA